MNKQRYRAAWGGLSRGATRGRQKGPEKKKGIRGRMGGKTRNLKNRGRTKVKRTQLKGKGPQKSGAARWGLLLETALQASKWLVFFVKPFNNKDTTPHSTPKQPIRKRAPALLHLLEYPGQGGKTHQVAINSLQNQQGKTYKQFLRKVKISLHKGFRIRAAAWEAKHRGPANMSFSFP